MNSLSAATSRLGSPCYRLRHEEPIASAVCSATRLFLFEGAELGSTVFWGNLAVLALLSWANKKASRALWIIGGSTLALVVLFAFLLSGLTPHVLTLQLADVAASYLFRPQLTIALAVRTLSRAFSCPADAGEGLALAAFVYLSFVAASYSSDALLHRLLLSSRRSFVLLVAQLFLGLDATSSSGTGGLFLASIALALGLVPLTRKRRSQGSFSLLPFVVAGASLAAIAGVIVVSLSVAAPSRSGEASAVIIAKSLFGSSSSVSFSASADQERWLPIPNVSFAAHLRPDIGEEEVLLGAASHMLTVSFPAAASKAASTLTSLQQTGSAGRDEVLSALLPHVLAAGNSLLLSAWLGVCASVEAVIRVFTSLILSSPSSSSPGAEDQRQLNGSSIVTPFPFFYLVYLTIFLFSWDLLWKASAKRRWFLPAIYSAFFRSALLLVLAPLRGLLWFTSTVLIAVGLMWLASVINEVSSSLASLTASTAAHNGADTGNTAAEEKNKFSRIASLFQSLRRFAEPFFFLAALCSAGLIAFLAYRSCAGALADSTGLDLGTALLREAKGLLAAAVAFTRPLFAAVSLDEYWAAAVLPVVFFRITVLGFLIPPSALPPSGLVTSLSFVRLRLLKPFAFITIGAFLVTCCAVFTRPLPLEPACLAHAQEERGEGGGASPSQQVCAVFGVATWPSSFVPTMSAHQQVVMLCGLALAGVAWNLWQAIISKSSSSVSPSSSAVVDQPPSASSSSSQSASAAEPAASSTGYRPRASSASARARRVPPAFFLQQQGQVQGQASSSINLTVTAAASRPAATTTTVASRSAGAGAPQSVSTSLPAAAPVAAVVSRAAAAAAAASSSGPRSSPHAVALPSLGLSLVAPAPVPALSSLAAGMPASSINYESLYSKKPLAQAPSMSSFPSSSQASFAAWSAMPQTKSSLTPQPSTPAVAGPLASFAASLAPALASQQPLLAFPVPLPAAPMQLPHQQQHQNNHQQQDGVGALISGFNGGLRAPLLAVPVPLPLPQVAAAKAISGHKRKRQQDQRGEVMDRDDDGDGEEGEEEGAKHKGGMKRRALGIGTDAAPSAWAPSSSYYASSAAQAAAWNWPATGNNSNDSPSSFASLSLGNGNKSGGGGGAAAFPSATVALGLYSSKAPAGLSAAVPRGQEEELDSDEDCDSDGDGDTDRGRPGDEPGGVGADGLQMQMD